jgi:hypothetical protein
MSITYGSGAPEQNVMVGERNATPQTNVLWNSLNPWRIVAVLIAVLLLPFTPLTLRLYELTPDFRIPTVTWETT